jgi:hypothetical protein
MRSLSPDKMPRDSVRCRDVHDSLPGSTQGSPILRTLLALTVLMGAQESVGSPADSRHGNTVVVRDRFRRFAIGAALQPSERAIGIGHLNQDRTQQGATPGVTVRSLTPSGLNKAYGAKWDIDGRGGVQRVDGRGSSMPARTAPSSSPPSSAGHDKSGSPSGLYGLRGSRKPRIRGGCTTGTASRDQRPTPAYAGHKCPWPDHRSTHIPHPTSPRGRGRLLRGLGQVAASTSPHPRL